MVEQIVLVPSAITARSSKLEDDDMMPRAPCWPAEISSLVDVLRNSAAQGEVGEREQRSRGVEEERSGRPRIKEWGRVAPSP